MCVVMAQFRDGIVWGDNPSWVFLFEISYSLMFWYQARRLLVILDVEMFSMYTEVFPPDSKLIIGQCSFEELDEPPFLV